MTIPRLELGISRVSGERVSHCTIQSLAFFSNRVFMRQEGVEEKRIGGRRRERKESERRSRKGQCRETKERKKEGREETCGGE